MDEHTTLIEQILSLAPADAVAAFKKKTVVVPKWEYLQQIYYVENHPVNDTSAYKDEALKGGGTDKMTRATLSLPKLIASRITGFCVGIPVKRVYDITEEYKEKQEEAQALMERIYRANRIKSVDIDRWEKYFACCEMLTLWYATQTETPHHKYGVESNLKLRCRTFSPMSGHSIYPQFDSTGDYVGVGIEQSVTAGEDKTTYFDIYTTTQHIQYMDSGDGFVEAINESIEMQKNPTIYASRSESIYWDGKSKIEEIEWSTSRAGNALRKNSDPFFGVFADEEIGFGSEEEGYNTGNKKVAQFPKGSDARYITWQLNQGALEFYNKELRDMTFMETQMPDISFEKMRELQLSGVAFDRVFIDAHLRVIKEQGVLTEFLGREFNVIKEFAKAIAPDLSDALDMLDCEIEITPFTISSETDDINNLSLANGGMPIMSQLESIQRFGRSRNPQATLDQINKEQERDVFEPTV